MIPDIVIGTRGSRLALWQAEFVRSRLAALHPQKQFHLAIIKTSGDRNQTASLTEIGGKGVFTKELENALLAGEIHLAVHSLKDLPTMLPENLGIAAVLPREDARDALVMRSGLTADSLKNLPPNSVVGTSSLRRAAQLKNLRPDAQIKDIRGNVDSRLKKLDAGEYDAILLAVAGLKRLGYDQRISAILESDEMLSQVGQGALAVETRCDDAETNALVAALNDAATKSCAFAERAFLRGLGGGCQFPIAAFARIENDRFHLRGLVAEPTGARILRDEISGAVTDADELGKDLAARLLAQGAADLIGK